MTNPNTTWKFQTADGLSVHDGSPTDARGLELRAACGFTHVKMADAGWLQISVAIRKLVAAERMAALTF